MKEFTRRVIELVRSIPHGKVSTYGDIAAAAGSPRAARQVVRILHTCSETYSLPWHRVVSRDGQILLPHGGSFEKQYVLLCSEGLDVSNEGSVNLKQYAHRF
jgi:methylated-DNA-protein-cysteine methyltransferase-like protein